MTTLSCTTQVLESTITALRAAGGRGEERVVLWLAHSSDLRRPYEIVEVYEPEQETAVDFFRLPTSSLRDLMVHLRERRLRVVAQVHSHPGAAFHSKADDEWAIVRNVGALSLVLPRFARSTTPENFMTEVVTYELFPDDRWTLVPNEGPEGRMGRAS